LLHTLSKRTREKGTVKERRERGTSRIGERGIRKKGGVGQRNWGLSSRHVYLNMVAMLSGEKNALNCFSGVRGGGGWGIEGVEGVEDVEGGGGLEVSLWCKLHWQHQT